MSEPLWSYGSRAHADPVLGAPALEARGLCVCYETGRCALDCVDCAVAAGTLVALVGPNGAGKSTLLKAVAGLLPSAGGTIRVYGQPVGACHHRVAYLPQRSEVDWRFPVTVERLVLGGRFVHLGWLRRPGARDRAVARAALERLGLAEVGDRQIGRLSGGQQQRALLARALAQEAELLLLDEPLNAIDQLTRMIVLGIFDELKAEGRTAVVATHDLGLLESEFDDSVRLAHGRLAGESELRAVG